MNPKSPLPEVMPTITASTNETKRLTVTKFISCYKLVQPIQLHRPDYELTRELNVSIYFIVSQYLLIEHVPLKKLSPLDSELIYLSEKFSVVLSIIVKNIVTLVPSPSRVYISISPNIRCVESS